MVDFKKYLERRLDEAISAPIPPPSGKNPVIRSEEIKRASFKKVLDAQSDPVAVAQKFIDISEQQFFRLKNLFAQIKKESDLLLANVSNYKETKPFAGMVPPKVLPVPQKADLSGFHAASSRFDTLAADASKGEE